MLHMDEVLHEGWRDQLDDLGTRKNGLYRADRSSARAEPLLVPWDA